MTAVVSLLFADTARSKAYAQMLAHRRIRAASALIVTSPDRPRWGQTDTVAETRSRPEGLWLPDTDVPLEDSVSAVADEVQVVSAGTLNDEEVVNWRTLDDAGLTVFSGFGGEIVRSPTLDAGAPLLHIHSGWLPDYRGSTTIYYSILAEGTCAVSAILLEQNIDTGPLVARRKYPVPPPGVDVDYAYDSAIRADLLADVVTSWLDMGGEFDRLETQPAEGTTYYIIHPVLKHLALSRLGTFDDCEG